MTHIRFALATALLTFGGATMAFAQQPAPVPAQGVHAHAKGGRREGGLNAQLFKGMKLSAAEKANIRTVHAKYAPQLKAVRDQFKPQMDAARAARQRGDTAAMQSVRQAAMAQREQTRKIFEAERTELRAALSAENQTKFDANAAAVRGRLAQRVSRGGKPGGRTAPGQVPRV